MAKEEPQQQDDEAVTLLHSGLWFHRPFKDPRQLSPIVLAYIGDAVYELLIRQYLVSLPNHKLHHLHKQATSWVSAKAQFTLLQRWQPLLTEEEADVVRRGRNAKSGAPPKNADTEHYRQATALECLIGYLYYYERCDRIYELLSVGIGDTAEAASQEEGEA